MNGLVHELGRNTASVAKTQALLRSARYWVFMFQYRCTPTYNYGINTILGDGTGTHRPWARQGQENSTYRQGARELVPYFVDNKPGWASSPLNRVFVFSGWYYVGLLSQLSVQSWDSTWGVHTCTLIDNNLYLHHSKINFHIFRKIIEVRHKEA